jgi:hypothetical protein
LRQLQNPLPRPLLLALAIVVTALCAQSVRAAEPSRDLDDYFAFAFRRMLLKDFHIEAPGCSLGVNCQASGRTCGRLRMRDAIVPAPGQLVGDMVCGPGSFYQVFRNNVEASCSPDCSMISDQGPGPKCETPFDAPILGDLDHDGQASCDGNCRIDFGDVAAACGVPYPLPSCDSSRGVLVYAGSDCVPVSLDMVPGNRECDLKAGTYGMIRVRNKGRINFGTGTTVACTLAVGKAARVTSNGPALILIPGSGWASFGNLSDVGGACRSFKVVTESGPLRFGKHGEFHLDACTLSGTLRLGHDNNLRGRFVSGGFVTSDYDNTGGCCEGTTTTTSTTIPPNAVCCQNTNQQPPQCRSAASAAACLESGGLPGPAESVCNADQDGGGRCTDAPPNPGGCCQFAGSCAIGGALDETVCSSLGGAFVTDAICNPDGNCGEVPPPPPEGCCQFDGSCTVAANEATCTSLGGAFVTDAICTTSGQCESGTTTTSTTATTMTTIGESTSTTSTSSSTSTSNTLGSTSTSTTSTTNTTMQSGPVCCENASVQPPVCGSAESSAACIAGGGVPAPPGATCQAAPEGGGRCSEAPPNPGGCCQFDGSCAIGGNLDEATCSSLGGAFVTDAICTPSGQCESGTTTTSTTATTMTTIGESTSTTSTSSSTSTSNTFGSTSTSTTFTTSTTSTTMQSGPVCCENASVQPPVCGSAESSAACIAGGGVPAPPGATCQAAPEGGGRCSEAPPNPGGCCQFDGSCAIGGNLDEATCSSLGGTLVTDAICTPSGQCEPGTTTTSTTATTMTTIGQSTSTTSTSSSTSTSNTLASTSSTSTSSTSSTSTTDTTSTVKTTSTTNTTNTTLPGSGFTRTLGFYKTHPNVTQWILDQAHGISVCGVEITNTNYDDAHSALEALCISPQGDLRLQLVRQLTAAALTMAAGGATYADFNACNTICASNTGSSYTLGDCINSADNFNNSGDNLPAPFDGFESGAPDYCKIAHMTSCNVLDPDSCQR